MKIEATISIPNQQHGSTVANAFVKLDDVLCIRNVRVCNGKNGLFVSMPQFKTGEEYKDVCFCASKKIRQQFDAAVLKAYEQKISEPTTQSGISQSL